jgi:hypothetical protein
MRKGIFGSIFADKGYISQPLKISFWLFMDSGDLKKCLDSEML